MSDSERVTEPRAARVETANGAVDLPPGVLVVRRGPGANCSSVGSAVEMLFLSATVGASVLAAVTAALRPHVARPVDVRSERPGAEPSATAPDEEPVDPTEAG